MTRPRKQTVNYFPHICKHGKTMFILEQRYGNDGYAFWFKTLELLGSSEGHFIDCGDLSTWEYLQSITRLPKETCTEILDLLATLDAIDSQLWEYKVIWSDKFVEGVTDAYRNRVLDIPKRPDNLRKIAPATPQSVIINPQTKLENTKLKKTRGNNKSLISSDFKISDEVRKWAEGKFDRLDEHLEAFIDYAKANAKQYADWDSAFKKAIREDWGKIRTTIYGKPKEEKPEWMRKLSEN